LTSFPAQHQDISQAGESPQLAGLVAIITGASRGIGRSTAEMFAQHGARVVVCSRTNDEVNATIASIQAKGGIVIGRRTDIGSPRQAQALVKLTVRRFGKVDVLINNAGILGPRVPLSEYPIADWDEVIRINLSGTYYMTRAVVPFMMRQQNGCVINVTSSLGRQGRAGWGAYAVSKFGVEGLTQVFAEELRPDRVRVFAFNPGGTRTHMRAEAYPAEDPERLRSPAEAADALSRLVLYASLEQSGRSYDLPSVPKEATD